MTETNAPTAKAAILEWARFPLKSIVSNNESKFFHVPFQAAT